MHVAAVDLTAPAIADFDLAISRRCAVADHKMIRETVLHPANMPVVIVENARVALLRAAVVDDNKLPATAFHRRAADRFDDGACQITVANRTTPRPETESARGRRRGGAARRGPLHARRV